MMNNKKNLKTFKNKTINTTQMTSQVGGGKSGRGIIDDIALKGGSIIVEDVVMY